MKNILLSILGVLSIVVSLAFSSYSVNAASNGHWANHMREDMKKDNNSGTLHLTEEVLISMMGLTLVLLFMEMAVCMLCMMVKFYMLVGIL